MLTNLLTAKLLSAAAAAVLATGTTAAAAATGSLPEPAQNFMSATASRVGFTLPGSGGHMVLKVSETTTTTAVVIETTTTTINPPLVEEPTTTTTTVVAAKPSPEVCAAARLVEAARGCSEPARAAAPGQTEKAAPAPRIKPTPEPKSDNGPKMKKSTTESVTTPTVAPGKA